MANPVLTFEWKDKETDATGWVVIDCIINDVAGGGIFMKSDATQEETAAIAKNMSRKFTVCNPQIGGAKAGIRFNHQDPKARDVLRRFILANEGLLRNYWVTAGDLNTDDSFIEKVITEELKLSCCQAQLAAVVAKKTGQPDLSKQLAQIIPMPASPYFPLIEAAVGYGVAVSVEEGLKLIGKTDGSAKVVIQGFGAVGSSLAYYLYTKKIAKIVGIADKDGFIMNHDGIDVVEILETRKNKIERMKTAGASQQQLAEIAKNCISAFDLDVLMAGNGQRGKLQCQLAKDFKTTEDFTAQVAAIASEVFCPCALRYVVTPRVVEAMVSSGKKLLVSGANIPYGQFKDGKLVEDTEGEVVRLLEDKKIVIVNDWVSNSGTAQLFHRSLSVNFDLDDKSQQYFPIVLENQFEVMKRNIPLEILEACADPIRLYIQQSLAMSLVKGNIYRLHRGAEQLAAQRLKHPVLLGQQVSTTAGHRSRYALPPIQTSLNAEQKTQLCLSLAAECIEPKELRELFERCPNPVAYDGFEPSGRMHIAQGLFKARMVNALTKSGCTFIFWVADWFALLNHKCAGNMEAIQTLGHYFIEIWKASGMDMSRVKFLWASEEFSKHGDEYWAKVLDISTKNTLARIERCCTIMGRGEKDKLHASQIFYPCMQAADIFFLGVDICQLGTDQRKVNVLAREYAADTKQKPPVVLSHPMMPGLKKGQEKMSKSDPANALFMEDTAEEIDRKIRGAHCPPGGQMETIRMKDENTGKAVDITRLEANPCLEYLKQIVFDGVSGHVYSKDVINVIYTKYEDFEKDYHAGKITPQELKAFLTKELNKMLQPVRDHFTQNARAAKLLQEVKEIQARYAPAK